MLTANLSRCYWSLFFFLFFTELCCLRKELCLQILKHLGFHSDLNFLSRKIPMFVLVIFNTSLQIKYFMNQGQVLHMLTCFLFPIRILWDLCLREICRVTRAMKKNYVASTLLSFSGLLNNGSHWSFTLVFLSSTSMYDPLFFVLSLCCCCLCLRLVNYYFAYYFRFLYHIFCLEKL